MFFLFQFMLIYYNHEVLNPASEAIFNGNRSYAMRFNTDTSLIYQNLKMVSQVGFKTSREYYKLVFQF